MLQPNVLSSNSLKSGRLEDTCRGPSTLQETSFPDYEAHSTPREAVCQPPRAQNQALETHLPNNSIRASFVSPRSFGTSQKPLDSLQNRESANQSAVSNHPNRKQKNIFASLLLSLKRHINSPQSLLTCSAEFQQHPWHCFYFAPRCHSTTFAVSKKMARSRVRERCLM